METKAESGLPAEQSTVLFLRAATAERHRELETCLDFLRPSFTLENYQRTLQDFYGFWRPWESFVETLLCPALCSFFRERTRTAKIRNDLFAFGFSEADVLALPIASRLPALASQDAALGSMYVMEGSTLGGQILSRHFADHLGLSSEQSTFFNGYGVQTGVMWKSFASELSKCSPSSYDVMAAAANDTFQCLEDWVCR